MTKLSPSAESALETLREKHIAYTIAKTTIESELKRELAQRLSAIRHDRDMSLKLAADAGVPKTQLGKAIGTSNYRTIQDILAMLDSMSLPVAQDHRGSVQVERLDTGNYRITISNVGDNKLSGSAVVNREMGFVDGDPFVVPAIYRNNLSDVVVAQIG